MRVDEVEVVRVACSLAADVQQAVEELAEQLRGPAWSAILFFASPGLPMPELAGAMFEAFPDAVTVGCSTMGEVGPRGFTRGSVVAMGLTEGFGVAALPIDLDSFLFHDGGRIVTELVTRVCGEPSGLVPGRHVFLTLTDGASPKEELLVASLGTHAPGVPLVGGSAADDPRSEGTWVALDGRAFPRAAVVLLLAPPVPFEAFHLHHFAPTERRLVVTAADPDRRLVRELDGWPAVEALAHALDVPVGALRADPTRLLGHRVALGFRVGERYYLRSVVSVRDDALQMGGAVEEGAVLRLMRPDDLLTVTREGVRRVIEARGGALGMLLFHCAGRMLEAAARGVEEPLFHAMCPPHVPVCGFTTSGEQFGPMRVNGTLTGLVFYGRLDVDGDATGLVRTTPESTP